MKSAVESIALAMNSLVATAERENRQLTPEEQGAFAQLEAEFKIANARSVADGALQASAVPAPRVEPGAGRDGYTNGTPVPQSGSPSFSGGAPAAHRFSNHGFVEGPGSFLAAVYNARVTGHADQRLQPTNAISTWGGETVGADGGYALPPQFTAGIMSAVLAEDSFIGRMSPIPAQSNMVTVPVNVNPAWSSTGITSAKTDEGGTITASKPSLGKVNIVMHKLASLVHASDESLSDMAFLGEFIMREMGEHLRYQLEDYILNGTGVDQPLGILQAPGLLTIPDGTSTATTLGAEDVFAMKAAALPGSGAFWLVNPTVLPALWSLKSDATNGYPLFAADLTKAPEGTLLGLPVFKSEAAPILDTAGDITLIVPRGYLIALRGVKTATTIGFAFDQDLESFRATMRVGGAPVLSAPVTRAKSATAYSAHLIALAGGRS